MREVSLEEFIVDAKGLIGVEMISSSWPWAGESPRVGVVGPEDVELWSNTKPPLLVGW